MRIASSPNLRIAAGLPFAALLSIVGYRVFRRWISHGLEVLLERADDLSWLVNWDVVAGSTYRTHARTHLTKPALIGSWPDNGPNTCASIEASTLIPSVDHILRLTACSPHDLLLRTPALSIGQASSE